MLEEPGLLAHGDEAFNRAPRRPSNRPLRHHPQLGCSCSALGILGPLFVDVAGKRVAEIGREEIALPLVKLGQALKDRHELLLLFWRQDRRNRQNGAQRRVPECKSIQFISP